MVSDGFSPHRLVALPGSETVGVHGARELFCISVCSVLQCVAVCCSVLQCVAVCCSVLQCVYLC